MSQFGPNWAVSQFGPKCLKLSPLLLPQWLNFRERERPLTWQLSTLVRGQDVARSAEILRERVKRWCLDGTIRASQGRVMQQPT